MIKAVINGAFGRMGRAVAEKIEETDGMCVSYGADIAPGTAAFPVGDSLAGFTGEADVVIDFSHRSQTEAVLDFALSRSIPAVIATTGQTEDEKRLIEAASEKVPVFLSANMSVGVALLCRLCKEAAAALPEADAEIIEKHHNKKLDAPSGTALMIAEGIKEARGRGEVVCDRSARREARGRDEIGIQSLRAGNIVGEHEVLFALGNEHIAISHSAFSRAVFADGAVRAAAFLIGKKPGLYNMEKLLEQGESRE